MKPILAIIVTSALSAAAGSALTWHLAYPKIAAEVNLTVAIAEQMRIDEAVRSRLADVTTKAVAQIHAEEKARNHDAVARVVSVLNAAMVPVHKGMIIQEQRRILLYNAGSMSAIDTGECPPVFQQVYSQASVALTAYAEVFQQAPISAKTVIGDLISIWDTGGLKLPVILVQAAGVHEVLSAQAASLAQAQNALGRLAKAAGRYGVVL